MANSQELKEEAIRLIESVDDVNKLEIFVRLLKEGIGTAELLAVGVCQQRSRTAGRFQRETGSDSSNRPSRRINHPQERDSALLSPEVFPGQSKLNTAVSLQRRLRF